MYGTPPVGRFATVPNTNEKMPAASNGWATTQKAPRAVCRYRSLTSRSASELIRSRKNQSSRTSIARHPVDGSISMTGGVLSREPDGCTSAPHQGGGADAALEEPGGGGRVVEPVDVAPS